jgi:hypothetical protein
MKITLKHQAYVAMSLLALLGFTASGCSPTATTENAAASHDHDHDHDHAEEEEHEHEHRHGEHGGEISILEPGHYEIEWKNDSDSGEVKIYTDAIAEKSAKIEKLTITTKIGDKEPVTYDFTTVEGNVYSLKNTDLATVIDSTSKEDKTTSAKIAVTIDGKEQTAKLVNMHH